MTEKVCRSKCCNAKVRTDGMPDFLGSREVCTVSFICLKCGKPCDAAKPKSQKREIRATEESRMPAAKKRIKEGKKRLDFQGKMLQKLFELFDGITIHPVKGVILTSKKKRQLAELKEMEKEWNRNIFKKRIKKPRK